MTKNIGPLTSPLSRNDKKRILLISFILGKTKYKKGSVMNLDQGRQGGGQANYVISYWTKGALDISSYRTLVPTLIRQVWMPGRKVGYVRVSIYLHRGIDATVSYQGGRDSRDKHYALRPSAIISASLVVVTQTDYDQVFRLQRWLPLLLGVAIGSLEQNHILHVPSYNG